ncbi:MAG TPA: hypothetical protein VGM36_14365, partial [Rhizomicrobium sp.]
MKPGDAVRSLKGGLPHRYIVALAAGACALAACSVSSYAASVRPKDTDTLTVNLSTFLTPQQFDNDGSVLGVRARGKSAELPALQ